MDTKKIFLTTLSELGDRNNIDYYVCDEGAEYGTMKSFLQPIHDNYCSYTDQI